MKQKNHANAKTPSPLVMNVKDLENAPGVSRELKEQVAASKDFGVALVGVQEGSSMNLDLRLDSVHEGILVSGTVVVDVVGECGRCLDPLDYEMDVHVSELYYFEGSAPQNGESDEEECLVEDDSIDLEPALRDAIVSALPFQPVCQDDCAGLCSECGVRFDDDPEHRHESIDPRWAALQRLGDQSADTTPHK